eukprot:3620655-Rhodomonas_salina.3
MQSTRQECASASASKRARDPEQAQCHGLCAGEAPMTQNKNPATAWASLLEETQRVGKAPELGLEGGAVERGVEVEEGLPEASEGEEGAGLAAHAGPELAVVGHWRDVLPLHRRALQHRRHRLRFPRAPRARRHERVPLQRLRRRALARIHAQAGLHKRRVRGRGWRERKPRVGPQRAQGTDVVGDRPSTRVRPRRVGGGV